MNSDQPVTTLAGELLDEDTEFDMMQLCRICSVSSRTIQTFVTEGIIEPLGDTPGNWRFRTVAVRRVRSALRLEQDLGVNYAGAALALDLIAEIQALRSLLERSGER